MACDGEHDVAAAAAKAFEIEADVPVAGSLDRSDHLVMKVAGKEAGELIRGDFEAGDFFMVAHAETGKAQVVEGVLGGLDLREPLGGDGRAVGQPTGEAGGGGFVGIGQTQQRGEVADVLFMQTRFEER